MPVPSQKAGTAGGRFYEQSPTVLLVVPAGRVEQEIRADCFVETLLAKQITAAKK
jgi:hypothetical protein